MNCDMIYIEGHIESMKQSTQGMSSFEIYDGWDVNKYAGVTPENVKSCDEFNWKIIENSRLHNFKQENENRFLTKLSCVINHIKFWRRVVDADETMAFLEHDAVCTGDWKNPDFDEYLILNIHHAFRPPNKLGLKQFAHVKFSKEKEVQNLPEDYPLKYYRDNHWKDSFMAPGTGSYAITPKGAKNMLKVAEESLDQSDFLLNTYNVNIQYLSPSPVKFNNVNLSTSYGI